MPTQQQPRPIQTVGIPRPPQPNYSGLFLEPDLPDGPEDEDEEEATVATFG
ncbi:hypothetical protein [Streptomyces sp. Wb2n-11]|uniref:hypothetical protein n=1 Tax=Streptomyces sp. Wb2n-11 TaxID=1030533 RepID=UPI000AF09F10|nr:hypothetical protein [Streptomyces sp. Wb2n-11]